MPYKSLFMKPYIYLCIGRKQSPPHSKQRPIHQSINQIWTAIAAHLVEGVGVGDIVDHHRHRRVSDVGGDERPEKGKHSYKKNSPFPTLKN